MGKKVKNTFYSNYLQIHDQSSKMKQNYVMKIGLRPNAYWTKIKHKFHANKTLDDAQN